MREPLRGPRWTLPMIGGSHDGKHLTIPAEWQRVVVPKLVEWNPLHPYDDELSILPELTTETYILRVIRTLSNPEHPIRGLVIDSLHVEGGGDLLLMQVLEDIPVLAYRSN